MKFRCCLFSAPILGLTALALATFLSVQLLSAAQGRARGKDRSSKLQISRDPASGAVTVSWNGGGVLKQSPTLHGKFKPVRGRRGSHTTRAASPQMIFATDVTEGVISVNAVGYVNVWFPPGLRLIANPLLAYENTVESLFINPPDGAQVYKYVPDVGYEVSAYDAAEGVWSNPDMDLSPGIGFFFSNPTSSEYVNTFVGEVLQGVLVNHLPAGFSTEGALVPQPGSINSLHHIPGQTGDLLRLYVNDGQGGGDYVTSTYSGDAGGWVPDLSLGIAEGFISEKQYAQDWVRVFSVLNP